MNKILFFIFICISRYNTNNWYQYTLNQVGDRKYVGITNNINKRLNKHFSGKGAKWTQKYNPISILEINYVGSYEDAKKIETKKYYEMKSLYGADKVRGAGYTNSLEKKLKILIY